MDVRRIPVTNEIRVATKRQTGEQVLITGHGANIREVRPTGMSRRRQLRVQRVPQGPAQRRFTSAQLENILHSSQSEYSTQALAARQKEQAAKEAVQSKQSIFDRIVSGFKLRGMLSNTQTWPQSLGLGQTIQKKRGMNNLDKMRWRRILR